MGRAVVVWFGVFLLWCSVSCPGVGSLNLTDILSSDSLDVKIEGVEGLEGADEEAMKGLLNWAIANSDPEMLRKAAEKVKAGESIVDIDASEMIKLLNAQPSETDLLKAALADLKNGGRSEKEHLHSLEVVQELVEPIDNANDLKALDGIEILVAYLDKGDTLATQAAYVLGTAASNNPTFQGHLMESNPEIFQKLVKMASGDSVEGSVKALFALYSLVGNLQELRTEFYTAGGLNLLHKLLKRENSSSSLTAKCLGFFEGLLVMDKLDIKDKDLVETVLSFVHHDNLDIKEKALSVGILFAELEHSEEAFQGIDLEAILSRVKSDLEELQEKDKEDTYITELLELVDTLAEGPVVRSKIEGEGQEAEQESLNESSKLHDEL